jgi:hypothetical protein
MEPFDRSNLFPIKIGHFNIKLATSNITLLFYPDLTQAIQKLIDIDGVIEIIFFSLEIE